MPKHAEARPEDNLAGKKRPFTGAEFLESLRDAPERKESYSLPCCPRG